MITKEDLMELVEKAIQVALIKNNSVKSEDFYHISICDGGYIEAVFSGHRGAEDDKVEIEFEDLHKTTKQLIIEKEKEDKKIEAQRLKDEVFVAKLREKL